MHMTPLDTSESPHAKLLTLPLVSTVLEGGFWFEKSSINRKVTLKHGYKEMTLAGNFNNLRLVFGQGSGQFRGLLFADSDLYKWLEAVSYELENCYDLELNEMANTLIDLIEKAQGNDGYINSYWEVVEPGKRWTDLAHGHELYCAGHLIQAGIAHHRSTKDTRLLNIALRFADYINSEFNHSGLAASPGHPEIELALIELYRHTGEQKYLNLCRYFLDQRGTNSHHSDQFMPIYYQDHIPVRNARTMAGHAVRQLYLTSGMADLYLETGEKALLDALERQWNDMATHHLFITGGVGSQHEGESFGTSYDLPNEKCYCETCAQIANIMWNWRMLLITGESQYADLIELIMFNGFISGVSVKGDKFFYENPLQNRKASEGSERRSGERQHWYRCACCPPNIMRTISSINQYFATMTERGIQIHQFGEYSIKHRFKTFGQVILKSQTEYPWNGTVLINVLETPAEEWSLSFRNPGWCEKLSITINGQLWNDFIEQNGYVHIDRSWEKGDKIIVTMHMPTSFVQGHPSIEAIRGCVAIKRGPMVYCIEESDQVGSHDLAQICIDPFSKQIEETWHEDLLGGVVTIETDALAVESSEWEGLLYKPVSGVQHAKGDLFRLTAIPYYSWANRHSQTMRVWIPTSNLAN